MKVEPLEEGIGWAWTHKAQRPVGDGGIVGAMNATGDSRSWLLNWRIGQYGVAVPDVFTGRAEAEELAVMCGGDNRSV